MKPGYKFKTVRLKRSLSSAGEQLAFSDDSEAIDGSLLGVHLGYQLITLSVYNGRNQSKWFNSVLA